MPRPGRWPPCCTPSTPKTATSSFPVPPILAPWSSTRSRRTALSEPTSRWPAPNPCRASRAIHPSTRTKTRIKRTTNPRKPPNNMSRTLIARILAGALLLTGCWIAYMQNQGPPPALTLNKVKDDLYEIEGDGGNVAVYVTSEGVILVDDKFEQDHEGIMEKVKSVTSQPVKYVITTHHHSDHSGGNVKFMGTAEIISTANARANIIEHKQPGAPDSMTPAGAVFTKDCSVF